MQKKLLFLLMLPACTASNVQAWDISWLKNQYLIGGAATVGTVYLGVKTYKRMQKPIVPKKQVAVYYASKDPQAPLITEPVEWPVKLIYANNIIGRFLSSFVNFFDLGKHVTKKEGHIAQSSNPKVVHRKIAHYAKFYKNELDMSIFDEPDKGFTTFNEWFTRTLKNPDIDRPLEDNHHAVVSPADSKLLIIPDITLHTQVTIKEKQFDVATFLKNKALAKTFEGGTMMIFRLAPYDYHRYHFPCTCTVRPEIQINGNYHSVNPRAFVLGHKPLTENKRSYQMLTSTHDHATKIIMAQIGATAVASIVNNFMDYNTNTLRYHAQTIFNKGNETGYFQFGGSTVVLLFPKDTIVPDAQIVKNSLNGYETAVKVRETIGHWKLK